MKKIFDLFEVHNIQELKSVLDSDILVSATIEKARQVKKRNQLLDEQIRFAKYRNDFIENFGVDISDTGKKYLRKSDEPNNSKSIIYSPDQWRKIFEILVTTSEDFSKHSCVCGFACQRRETMATHLYDNHHQDIRFALQ